MHFPFDTKKNRSLDGDCKNYYRHFIVARFIENAQKRVFRNKSTLASLSAATAKLKRAAKIMRTNQQTV
jgi:hypothetical protein